VIAHVSWSERFPFLGDVPNRRWNRIAASFQMQPGTIAIEPHLMDPARASRYRLDRCCQSRRNKAGMGWFDTALGHIEVVYADMLPAVPRL
jgi:hypothetical protein